jgi:hypothetical protein
MALVSLSVFAQNEKVVGSVKYKDEFSKNSGVGITIIANEKFETRLVVDRGILMLKKETKDAFIVLLKEGLRYIDAGSSAAKIIELGKVESDSKFDKGHITVKYINFVDERFITIGFKYGVSILRLISLKKEDILALVELLNKTNEVSTDLLAELNKLK